MLLYEMVCPHLSTCRNNKLCTGHGGYIIIIMNACTFIMCFLHLQDRAQANPAAGWFQTWEIVLLTSAKPHPAH